MTEFKEALDQIDFCLKTIKLPHTEPKDNAIWSSGTALRPRITEETLAIARRALLIADRLKQEPSKGMIKAAYDCVPERPQPMETEGRFSANNALRIKEFKAMRDQLIREIEQGSKCSHEGYSFKEHGRCCLNCGELLTDFGD